MSQFRNSLIKLVAHNANLNKIRCYPRWSRRPPCAIKTEDDEKVAEKFVVDNKNSVEAPDSVLKVNFNYGKQPSKVVEKSKIKWTHPKSLNKKQTDLLQNTGIIEYKITRKASVSQKIKKEAESTDLLQTVIDKDGNFIYTKMKNKDARISSIMCSVKSEKNQVSILLEGKRLIKEALLSGCHMQYLLFSQKDDVEFLKPHLPNNGALLYKMPYREMQDWSNLTTSPGVMGIFKLPNLKNLKPCKDSLPLTIICDNIREPGNLGAILRTAAGAGCQKVILTKGCVNLWASKVTRSASGAHFKLQIEEKKEWTGIGEDIPEDANVLVADISTDEKNNVNHFDLPISPYYNVNYSDCKHVVLIIGGETHGVSAEAYQFAHNYEGIRVNVPLVNEIESLNSGTALGVIAFEIKRQIATNKE